MAQRHFTQGSALVLVLFLDLDDLVVLRMEAGWRGCGRRSASGSRARAFTISSVHRVARRTRNLLLEYTHDPRVAAPEIGDALAGSGGQDDPRHADVSFFWRIYARRPGSRAYLPVCCSEGPADGIEWKTAFAWTMKSSLVRKSVSLSMTISAWALASLRGKVPEQGEVLAEEGAYSEPRRDEEEKRVGLSERAEGELRVLLVSRWCSLAHPQPQPLQLVVAIAASISPFRSALSAGQWQWRTRIRTGSGETDARRRRVHGDVGMRRTENGQRRAISGGLRIPGGKRQPKLRAHGSRAEFGRLLARSHSPPRAVALQRHRNGPAGVIAEDVQGTMREAVSSKAARLVGGLQRDAKLLPEREREPGQPPVSSVGDVKGEARRCCTGCL